MNLVLRIEDFADKHHPKWIEFIRMVLGVVLMIKGITLIANKDQVILDMQASGLDVFTFMVTAQYVIALYIAGGFLITIGLVTRVVSFFELPILLATIIFIDYHKGLFALNSELGYSIIILVLLLFFLFYGSGKISVDNYLRTHREE